MTIPKNIWQTHEWDYDNLPQIYKKTSQTWKSLNPDWTYTYVSETQRREMIKDIRPSVLKVYDEFYDHVYDGENVGGVLQCDLWRVVALYGHGGVYADLDSICLGPLNEMLRLYSNKDIVISSHFITKSEHELLENSSSGIPYEFQVNSGAGFAAKKNSKVLSNILDIIEAKSSQFNGDLWSIFSSTCINADIELISYDFRWSLHSGAFNHKNTN